MLHRLDATIQSKVNAAVLWLIDRGIPKSLTVYAPGVVLLGSLNAESVLDGDPTDIIITGIASILFILMLEWKRRSIEHAESSNHFSTFEKRDRIDEFWKVFQVFFLVYDPLTEARTYGTVLSVIFWSAALLESYAIVSPRRPPRPPERKTVLVPQPSAT